MRLLRLVGNLILALVLIVLSAGVLLLGFGMAAIQIQEMAGLDHGLSTETTAQGGGVGEWLWIDQEPIYVRTWGDAGSTQSEHPWIVLVHGAQVEGSQTWLPLAQSLARSGSSVLAVDLRGCGRSVRSGDAADYGVRAQADLVAMVLNERRIQGATVVGYEYGAAVALQLAYAQPQFVERLVLLSPRLGATTWPLEQELARVPYAGSSLSWLCASGGPVWLLERHSDFQDDGTAPEGYWSMLQAYTKIEGTVAAQRALISVRDEELTAELPTITAPALLVVAEGDDASTEVATLLETTLVQADQAVLKDTGRAMHIEDVGQVAALVLRAAP